MSGYTKGEWKVNLYLGGAYALDVVKPNGDRIATLATVVSGREAASPTMFEALEAAEKLHAHRQWCPDCKRGSKCWSGAAMADEAASLREAALKKARGTT
jgi:hypothetical protein